MWRTVLIYGAALAAAAFVLQQLEYRDFARAFAPEFHVVLVAIGFTGLGLWAGRRLTGGPSRTPGSCRRAAPGLARETRLRLAATGPQLASRRPVTYAGAVDRGSG